MKVVFYIAAIVALVATVRVITSLRPMHALLYLVVSLLAVAVIFYVLGAPLAAAFEVITYAGAIMVLIVFVIMMLNLGGEAEERERDWLRPRLWIGPVILALILLVELIYVIAQAGSRSPAPGMVPPGRVGEALFGPYVLGVELVALLLMAAIVGASHIGRMPRREYHRFLTEGKKEVV